MCANFLNNAVDHIECYTRLKNNKNMCACTKICDIACLGIVLCADRVFKNVSFFR